MDLGTPEDGHSEAFGINERGHVVGVAIEDATGDPEWAFVWLFQDDYGFTNEHTLIQLHSLSSNESRAREINDAGLVVGRIGTGPSQAYGWYLSSGSISTLAIGPGGVSSEAWGVNDHTSPIATGFDDGGTCQFGGARGFEAEIDLSPLSLTSYTALAPNGPSSTRTRSFDINNDSPPSKAGTQTPCDGSPGCTQSTKPGIRWDDDNAAVLADFMSEQEEGRGINDAATVVGWGQGTFDEQECTVRALAWKFGQSPIDLGAELGEGPEQSWAEAINENDGVVGWHITQNVAVLWQIGSSSVDAVDLNTISLWDCGADPEAEPLKLIQAHDINDNGWIVGWGLYEGQPAHHAFLLIPRNDACLGDVNWDGEVDIDDYIKVFTDWGTCDPGAPCLGDVDYDCDADADDLDIIDENWGECGGESLGGGPPQWVTNVIDAFLNQSLTAEQAIAILEGGGSSEGG